MVTTIRSRVALAAFGAALLLALTCVFAMPAHAATSQTFTQTKLGYQAYEVTLQKGGFKLEMQAGASWSGVGVYAQIDSEGKGVSTTQMTYCHLGDPYQQRTEYVKVAETRKYYLVFYAYDPTGATGTTAKITQYPCGVPKSLTLKKTVTSSSAGDGKTVAYYKVKVCKRGLLNVAMSDSTGSSYSANVCLCNIKKKPFVSNDAWTYVKSGESAYFGVKKGTYILAVKSNAPVYKLTPKLTAVTKAGATKKSKAVAIAKGKTMKGVLAAGEKARWYKFKVTKSKKYTFALNGKTDYNGVKFTFSGDGYYDAYARLNTYSPSGTFQTEKLKPGTYYLKVTSNATSGRGGNGYFTIKWK